MERIIFTAITLIAVYLSIPAKDIKRPDSYAFTRAVEAYNEDKNADALEWLEHELSEHPNNGYAYTFMAGIYYQVGESGLALSAIQKALQLVPKNDKQWRSGDLTARGKIHLALNDTVSALEDYAQALRLNPMAREAIKDRANLYYEQGKYDLSDADWRRMIEIDPGDVMGHMGIGRNANAQKHWDDAIAQFDKAILMSPDYSNGYSFRAEAYLGKNNWNHATDDIVKALDIDGDDKAFYLMRNIPEEAESQLKAKLKVQVAKQPNNRYWPYCLGTLLQEKNQYEEAIPYYQEAHKIEAHPLLPQKIAECYKKLSAYQKALEYINIADSMNPDDTDIIDLKADIYSALGQMEECLKERDKYISLAPESSYGYLSRGQDLMYIGKYSLAADDFSTALMLSPILEYLYFPNKERGDAYRLAGKPELAVADYNKVVEGAIEHKDLFGDVLAGAYSGLGEHDKAIATMIEYLQNDTTSVASNRYDLACIYSRAGRLDDAIQTLRQAVEEGYSDYGHIRNDYDFIPLRDNPEFQSIISEMQKKSDLKYGQPNADDDTENPTVYETVEIPFIKENGITKVQCSINNLPLHFVFDTGAAEVTMSMVEANFMLKNGYIKPSDVIGSASYIDANGDISEGTVINLREVDFGGLHLDNVRASVVRNQRAPLLLGQSVLGRLGRIEIDNPAQKLIVTHHLR